MRKFAITAVVLGALAIPAPAKQQADVPHPASIEGVVVRIDTGEPMAKVRVQIRPAEWKPSPNDTLAVTGPSGQFHIDGIPPGIYRLQVIRNGFLSQEYGQRTANSPGTPLTLRAGQKVRDIAFWMVPAGAIEGSVYDEDGEPLLHVEVAVLQPRFENGNSVLKQLSSAVTNDLGQYRIFGLAPGRYYLRAAPPRGPSLRFTGNRGSNRSGDPANPYPVGTSGESGTNYAYAQTFYPNGLDPSQASPIHLAPGDQLQGMDIRLQLTTSHRIRGSVIYAMEKPEFTSPQLLLFSRRPDGGSYWGRGRTEADTVTGAFEFVDVAPGTYQIIAFVGRNKEMLYGQQSVAVRGADVQDLIITIHPGTRISGTISAEGMQSAQPATNLVDGAAKTMLESLIVGLEPETDLALKRPDSEVDTGGKFNFAGVPAGRYWVEVRNLPESFYLKSATLEGRDIMSDGFSVAGLEDAGRIDLRISPAGAALAGTTVDGDGRPVGGVQLTLAPVGQRQANLSLYRRLVTDQDGRFELKGVPPGDFALYAWEEIDPGADENLDFLLRFEKQAEELELQENEHATVSVQMIPASDTRQQ